MSDTPKTDAVIFDCAAIDSNEKKVLTEAVPVDFARAQERRIAELDGALQEISELISGHDGYVFDDIAKVLLGTKP